MATRPESRLVPALVSLCRAAGIEAEQLRARELLREASLCWPGEVEARWWKWLAEASKSLHLRARVADLKAREAWELCRDGAILTTLPLGATHAPVIVLSSTGRRVTISRGISEASRPRAGEELSAMLGAPDPEMQLRWLIMDAPELADAASGEGKSTEPWQRFVAIMKPEWSDIWIVVLFAFLVGLLSLATPIAVEALVNTVAFGRMLQPVIVLATLLFGFLMFVAAILGLQTYVVEIIQRRLFVRVAADLCFRLPRVAHQLHQTRHGPELVNRFFDVVTLQKVSAHLLLDGVTIVLATLVGMAVLAFYHPWLLGFDVLLLGTAGLGILALGRGAIHSGIEESKYKCRVAAWLEDIIRCPGAFKLGSAAEFAVDRTNYLTSQYLKLRQKHFRVLFRQILFVLVLQAIAGTVLLGFGGWLVIQGQLTLGQLVAAELIVAAILASLAKLGKHLEGFYDLLASVEKLGQLFDLPLERQDGIMHAIGAAGATVQLTATNCKVRGQKVWAKPLHLSIRRGAWVAVTGGPGSGKSLLLELLYGLWAPTSGHVEIDQVDPLDVRPDILRQYVALARGGEIFEGSLAENVHLHRPDVDSAQVRRVLDAVGLLDAALRLPRGLDTPLTSGGAPLSSNQQALLMLARAVSGGPKLLLVDSVLDALPDGEIGSILNHLRRELLTACTIVVATNRRAVVDACDSVLDLDHHDAALAASVNGFELGDCVR